MGDNVNRNKYKDPKIKKEVIEQSRSIEHAHPVGQEPVPHQKPTVLKILYPLPSDSENPKTLWLGVRLFAPYKMAKSQVLMALCSHSHFSSIFLVFAENRTWGSCSAGSSPSTALLNHHQIFLGLILLLPLGSNV